MSRKDLEFMAELEAASRLRPATPIILMYVAVMAFVVLAMLWMGMSEIEERTRGQGRIVPSREIQVVQSLEGGILAALQVEEGQHVKKGDIILRISDVQFSSEERGTEARMMGFLAKRERLKAEAENRKFSIPPNVTEKLPQVAANEHALYISRQQELKNAYQILDDRIVKATAELSEIDAQVAKSVENRRLLQQEITIVRDMVEKRAAPKLELIRLERELGDISGQINAQSQRRKALEAELQVARNEKISQDDRFRSLALEELHSVETEIAALEENLKSLGDRVSRAEIRAPVDGIVNKIAIKTIGGVIEPAMRLVEIVPIDDELKILARIRPEDVAFLHPGQTARVKITAYDATRYGTLEAELVRVAANSYSDDQGNVFFDIELKADRNYMGTEETPLPITPGMVAEVEVITGKRTILEYLLKPILRARSVAFSER